MGKVNFKSIVVGEGKMFIGPNRSTVDVDINTSGDDSTYYIGATQEGVAIGWEPDMVDIEVDQFGDAARVVQSKVKVMVKTTLAEATLVNLANAWGYSTTVNSNVRLDSGDGLFIVSSGGAGSEFLVGNDTRSGTQLNVGIHSTYPEEKYLRVEGTAPGSDASTTVYRTYRNARAIQYAASEHSLQRSDNVKFAIEFRCLPDSQYTGREYGWIKDSVTAPYSPYL